MATVFEISGSLALYRKPYTTTSTVSFPIPPPTAVAGLLGGILGIGSGSAQNAASSAFWGSMRGTQIAIQRLNVTAWYSATINFWNTKEPQKNPHIRIKHQFVRNPHYRIFVRGALENALDGMLSRGETVYTPYLGADYALADVTYLGRVDDQAARCADPNEMLSVVSAVPTFPHVDPVIDYAASGGLLKDIFPFRLDDQRGLVETVQLIYPSSPRQCIALRLWEGLEVMHYGEHCVAWLPAW